MTWWHRQEQSPCFLLATWQPIIILAAAAADPAALVEVIGVQHGPERHNPAKRAWEHAQHHQQDGLHAPGLCRIRCRITASINISA